jgi:hypothetical protein
MREKEKKSSLLPEERTDGLPMVHPADCLGKDQSDLQDFQLGTLATVLFLWDAVGDDDLVKRRGVDTGNGITAEHTMGDQGVDLGSTLLLQQLGSAGNGVGGVSQVIHEDAGLALDISHKHHGGILTIRDAGWASFLGR